jgi:hypothetical protein
MNSIASIGYNVGIGITKIQRIPEQTPNSVEDPHELKYQNQLSIISQLQQFKTPPKRLNSLEGIGMTFPDPNISLNIEIDRSSVNGSSKVGKKMIPFT